LAGDGRLRVRWDDGEERAFHLCWLRDNCRCERCCSSSGQKVNRTVDDHTASAVNLISAEVEADALRLRWSDHDQNAAPVEYDSHWLRKFAYSTPVIEDETAARQARFAMAPRDLSKGDLQQLPQVTLERISSGDEGVFEWMSKMNESGFCMVRNCGTEDGTVERVANLIGPVSHTIYGDTFDVKATPKPINIAYTDSALEPHMDLAYFESPPGVQMLHCIRFDSGVRGGDSTLIDGHAVAEEFQQRHPEAFRTLSQIPATFQKDHMDRAHPIKMFYQRPHITTNYLDQVTAVYWSPPFEGPLRVKEEFVEPYYKAYNAFRAMLLSDEMWDKYGCVFRLAPGDLLVFNNRRMLHGRNAFTSEAGTRHLQGCYLDVDTYLNKYRVLADRYDPQAADACLAAPGESRFGTSSHR